MIIITPVRIISKKYKHYCGKVYDLEVDHIHAYNVDGLAVHNSGGGSVVNNLLGITRIDPVKHDLLFERFLNPDRGHLPDIDQDYDYKRGPEVFQYIIDKYGKDYVANVCTFTAMQMKMAIRDVSKALGVPYEEVLIFSKNIPAYDNDHNPLNSISELKKIQNPIIQDFINKYPEVIKYAEVFEGTPRQIGQHPAGIAISPVPITDLIPVTRGKPTADGAEPGNLSQFEKEQFERSGLVKIDILKLNAVSQISTMLKLVKEYYPQYSYKFINNEIREENIPLDDPNTYKLLCDLDISGIFQMDNANISVPVLRKIQPKNIDELSALTALIRPGASGLDEYCAVKNGHKKQLRIDPRIDAILKPTYGAILYQETIMQLISIIFDISFGQADIYRRALEKKKKFPDKFKEFEDTIIERGIKNGFTKPVLEYIKNQIIQNAGYGFNRSHAYAYSYITAYMAFIKANFPLAFYAAMIDDDLDNLAIYISEAKAKGMTILLPDVSKSKEYTSIESLENKAIRIGLNAIKGVGEKAFQAIVANQPYASINEFFEKTPASIVNKRAIEALINSDAFDATPISFKSNDLKGLVLENHEDLYLDRGQLQQWYNIYYEAKNAKAEHKYIIAKNTLPLNLQEDPTLVFEADNTIIVPESYLSEFGIKGSGINGELTDDDKQQLISAGRRLPKGRLKAAAKKATTSFFGPFITHFNDIMNSETDYCQAYIDDIQKNGYSLLDFPYPYYFNPDKPLERANINGLVFGLLKSVTQLTSRYGNPYFRLEIITRDRIVSQFITTAERGANKANLIPWHWILYYGIPDKQYGGLKNRSPIYDATIIAKAGAAVFLKQRGKISLEEEQKFLQLLNSENTELNASVIHSYLVNKAICAFNKNGMNK